MNSYLFDSLSPPGERVRVRGKKLNTPTLLLPRQGGGESKAHVSCDGLVN